MRKHGERGRFAATLIPLAALIFGAPALSKARNLSPPVAETGYPRELINRPVCWSEPMSDEAVRCGYPQRQGGRAFR
jgi:hypothetical protein